MNPPRLTEVFRPGRQKDIVVSIPKGKRAEIEAEEADVAKREAAGERDITYYWEMGRMPKERPGRIYFAWDGAVRAYHEVLNMDREAGRIYMKTEINSLPNPRPMAAFRGFRYIERDK